MSCIFTWCGIIYFLHMLFTHESNTSIWVFLVSKWQSQYKYQTCRYLSMDVYQHFFRFFLKFLQSLPISSVTTKFNWFKRPQIWQEKTMLFLNSWKFYTWVRFLKMISSNGPNSTFVPNVLVFVQELVNFYTSMKGKRCTCVRGWTKSRQGTACSPQ